MQPAGLSFSGATGTGWTCGGTTTISCTRSNALAAGDSYPAITLNVTPTTAGSVTNVATVSGGGEANTGNNSASDPTTVLAPVDLTIDKSHSRQLHARRQRELYHHGLERRWRRDHGNDDGHRCAAGWPRLCLRHWHELELRQCQRHGHVHADHSDTRPAASAPDITLTVSVAAAAFPTVTNTASVSGGGEPAGNTGNNSDSDPTTVIAPDLTISKSHTGNFNQGVNGTYSLDVTNNGGAATSGTVTVTDVLPAGLGFVSANGAAGRCGFATGTVTCTRTNSIGAGQTARESR